MLQRVQLRYIKWTYLYLSEMYGAVLLPCKIARQSQMTAGCITLTALSKWEQTFVLSRKWSVQSSQEFSCEYLYALRASRSWKVNDVHLVKVHFILVMWAVDHTSLNAFCRSATVSIFYSLIIPGDVYLKMHHVIWAILWETSLRCQIINWKFSIVWF